MVGEFFYVIIINEPAPFSLLDFVIQFSVGVWAHDIEFDIVWVELAEPFNHLFCFFWCFRRASEDEVCAYFDANVLAGFDCGFYLFYGLAFVNSIQYVLVEAFHAEEDAPASCFFHFAGKCPVHDVQSCQA